MFRSLTTATCITLFAVVCFGDRPPAGRGPATTPAATQPVTTQSAGLPDTLLHQEFTFTDPAAGYTIGRSADDALIQFTKPDQGGFKIGFQDKDFEIQSDTAGSIATQMVASIKKQRAADKTVVVMAPKVEKDKRFQIVIHEKFKLGNETLDTLHIFNTVGPRVLELTMSSISPDQQVVDAIFDDGRTLFAAVKFDKKAFLKQKKIEDQQQRQRH